MTDPRLPTDGTTEADRGLPDALSMSDPAAERFWTVARAVVQHPDIAGRSPRSLASWEFEEWEQVTRQVTASMGVTLTTEGESAVAALAVALSACATLDGTTEADTALDRAAQWPAVRESRARQAGYEAALDDVKALGGTTEADLWCEYSIRGMRCLLRPLHDGGHSMSEGNHPLDGTTEAYRFSDDDWNTDGD